MGLAAYGRLSKQESDRRATGPYKRLSTPSGPIPLLIDCVEPSIESACRAGVKLMHLCNSHSPTPCPMRQIRGLWSSMMPACLSEMSSSLPPGFMMLSTFALLCFLLLSSGSWPPNATIDLPYVLLCWNVKLTRSLEVLRVSVNEGRGVDVTNAVSAEQVVGDGNQESSQHSMLKWVVWLLENKHNPSHVGRRQKSVRKQTR